MARPSILLVTLDTTRADVLFHDSGAPPVSTPAFDALAASGLRFVQAYATAPQTLPSHASLMTGLLPAGHGVHENARVLAPAVPLLAERLRDAGYDTAAVVSAFVLDRRFGIGRGFARYDDELGDGRSERPATETTDRALAALATRGEASPSFLWVHYFDAHHPYAPPEPFASDYPDAPYLGEVAAVDAALGRLVAGFRRAHAGRPVRIVVVGDHGESLGEHGEAQHGNLLYQGVVRVPLVLAGDGVPAGEVAAPVSIRRVHDTVLAWAGLDAASPLGVAAGEAGEAVVVAEAMKPYLQYGWRPQVMAVSAGGGSPTKTILAGDSLELYDLASDPGERRDLSGTRRPDRETLARLREYPLPGAPASTEALDAEERSRLAALGYVASDIRPPQRADAPRPVDRAHLFAALDRGSGLFEAGEYRAAVPVFADILRQDPHNLMAALRLAVAHSTLGDDAAALAAFDRAREIAPTSADVDHYLGLHHLRAGRPRQAEPLLVASLAAQPDRLPALEALARIRLAAGRLEEAEHLLDRRVALDDDPAALAVLGDLRMRRGETAGALAAFERARAAAGTDFDRHLELGVLYLASGRLEEARAALDAVPADHPERPMALFKRAQVAVLLGEPDRTERIAAARSGADAVTRPLVEREPLFR